MAVESKERTRKGDKALKDELMVAHWWGVLWSYNYRMGRKARGKKGQGGWISKWKIQLKRGGKKNGMMKRFKKSLEEYRKKLREYRNWWQKQRDFKKKITLTFKGRGWDEITLFCPGGKGALLSWEILKCSAGREQAWGTAGLGCLLRLAGPALQGVRDGSSKLPLPGSASPLWSSHHCYWENLPPHFSYLPPLCN